MSRFDPVSEEEALIGSMCRSLQSVGYKIPMEAFGLSGLRLICYSVEDLVRRVKEAEKTPNEERLKAEREARGDA